MQRDSFSLMEVLYTIVIIGIIAAVSIGRFHQPGVTEAAYQIARHIRLTQHLAMMEDRFNESSVVNWKITLWRITFISGTKGECYRIFADRDGNGGNPAKMERAIDPLTRKYLWGNTSCSDDQADVNENVLLWKSYGVVSVDVCGKPKNIAFDFFGRPGKISGNQFIPLSGDCVIGVNGDDGGRAEVTIVKETGYVEVTKTE